MSKTLITGHEVEVAEIERYYASPEFRAASIKGMGERLVIYGETLKQAAFGLLKPIESNCFGESESIAQQVERAEYEIEVIFKSLSIVINQNVPNEDENDCPSESSSRA